MRWCLHLDCLEDVWPCGEIQRKYLTFELLASEVRDSLSHQAQHAAMEHKPIENEAIVTVQTYLYKKAKIHDIRCAI